MALQELERKLAESFNGLREENKSLIQLLKERQDQLKSSLAPDVSHSQSENVFEQRETLNPVPGHIDRRAKVTFNTSQSRDNITAECFQTNSSDESRSYITEGQEARNMLARHSNNLEKDNQLGRNRRPEDTHKTQKDYYDNNTNSALRRRKIIDDNVCVSSKYQHTPTGTPKLRKKYGLNFSYSDTDSNDSADSFLRTSGQFQDLDKEIAELEERKQQRSVNAELREVEEMMAQRLLEDPGNDRQHASIVRTIDHRPKNVLFDVNEKEPLVETLNSMNNSKTSEQSSGKSSFMSRMRSMDNRMNGSREARPLLGYDWIAGVLENEGLFEETEGLFKEVNDFRRANREECVGSASVWDKSLDLRRPISPEIQDPGHTCIHSYTLNDRLFTESVNLNEEGKSVCPVCLISRKQPTKVDPAFVRVSIPRSSIAAPYKVMPHKRKSFDPSDSYALSKHCLAGWQNAKPSSLPTASTLDLKEKIIPKETTSYDEARKVAESFSRMGRLLEGSKELPEDRLTKELLNRSHCLRYELEVMKETLNQSKNPPQQLESY